MKNQPVSSVVQLRTCLAGLRDDAPIICQVVAKDGKVWNVFASFSNGEDCGFEWAVQPVILTLSHPDLATLP